MSKRAILLAGGRGTRLHPYTITLPKPLMPVGDYPILEIIVRQLVQAGFTHLTMAVNHQAEIIKAFFQDGEKWGIKIDYSMEDQPLGTMGPIKQIKDLPDQFLVMNGDILTDLDFGAFYDTHRNTEGVFSITSYEREQLVDYGVLQTENNRLIGMQEKPRTQYEVSTGIYMLSKEVLDYIEGHTNYGFDDLMHRLLQEQKPVNVLPYAGYWLDIGRADDYKKATEVFIENVSQFLKQ